MITAAVVAKSLVYNPPQLDSGHISPKSDDCVLLWECKFLMPADGHITRLIQVMGKDA